MAVAYPGKRFGSYDVEEAIGRGAMGLVYRARDVTLGRTADGARDLTPEVDPAIPG